MSYSKYLKSKAYYEKLYDEGSVYHCRKTEEAFEKVKEKMLKEDPKAFDKKENVSGFLTMKHIVLYHQTGEYYSDKEKTIQKWMDRDKKKDDLLKLKPPIVYCPKCNKKMKFILKDLRTDIDDNNLKVCYIYVCKNCKEKKGIYNTGEEYIFEGDYCPKCNTKWNSKSKRVKNKITSKYICKNCGYRETEVLDLGKPIIKTKKKKDLNFPKDRIRFCLSKEKGQEYIDTKPKIEELSRLVNDWKDKEKHKDVYEKVKKLKKLTLVELSSLLNKKLAKEKYQGLVISNPEIGKDLIVNFTIQDAKSGRVEYDSKRDLKKLLKSILEDTNWKLMSDGLSYKLGVLSGRLRGQDDEESMYQEMKKDSNEKLKYGQVYGKNGEIITL